MPRVHLKNKGDEGDLVVCSLFLLLFLKINVFGPFDDTCKLIYNTQTYKNTKERAISRNEGKETKKNGFLLITSDIVF